MTPCVVADTTVVALVAIPTSEAPAPAVLKKTRSPDWICDREIDVPVRYWSKLVRGTEMPALPMAHTTSPEQSNADGPVAPDWYGLPIFERAAETAAATPDDCWTGSAPGEEVFDPTPRRWSTALSSCPSTGSPCLLSNALTAERVCGPTTPSAVTPSLRCAAMIVARSSVGAGASARGALAARSPSALAVAASSRPVGGRPW